MFDFDDDDILELIEEMLEMHDFGHDFIKEFERLAAEEEDYYVS